MDISSINRDILVTIAGFAGLKTFDLLSTCKGLHAFRAKLTNFELVEHSGFTMVSNPVFSSRNIHMRRITGIYGGRVRVYVCYLDMKICAEIEFSRDRPEEDFALFRRNLWIDTVCRLTALVVSNALEDLMIGPHEFRQLVARV